jgi:hypothetical protein
MGSKYSGLKDKLSPFSQPQDFQQRVDEIKKTFSGQNVTQLARAFSHERREKQQLEAQVKIQNVALEALSQLLLEQLEASEISKFTLDSGETLYISDEPYISTEDKGKLMTWLKKHKLQSMFTVSWQSLNAFCKESMINGKPLPDGTKCFMKSSIRMRGGSQIEE